jgi:MFS family permease
MMDAGEGGSADTASEAVLDETSIRTPAVALRVPQAARRWPTDSGLPVVPLVALATVPLLSSIAAVAYLPALPAIARSYHASAALLGWTVSVPSLVGAAFYPIGGRLGDLYGRRRVLLGLVALFTAGSACVAVFHSDATLILGRAAQAAIGAAAPLSTALVTELVRPERRARVVPLIIGVTGAGFGLGFLGGALVVEDFGLAALSAGLAALGVAAAGAVAATVIPRRTAPARGSVDWLGAVLLCAPIGMLLLALGQAMSWGWSSPQIIVLLIAAPAVLGLSALRQATRRDGLIPTGLLAVRGVPAIYALCVLVGLAQVSLYILLPELLQASPLVGGFRLSTATAGLVLSITCVAFVLGGILSKSLITRLGGHAATASAMAVACCGYATLAIARATLPGTAVLTSITFLGISISLAAVVYGIAQAAPQRTVATALALLETAIAIGSAVGAQLQATVVAQLGTVGGLPTKDAYTAGFTLGAGLAFIASLVALATYRRLAPERRLGVPADLCLSDTRSTGGAAPRHPAGGLVLGRPNPTVDKEEANVERRTAG